MQFDKQQIIDLLQSQGAQDKVAEAQQALPDKVDTEQHADLLSRFGIDPKDLAGKLAGGLGGAGAGLGGLLGS
ncbi:hypothetical protein EV189_3769 [Motilibacter rhizosphaerae]|uniref:Uncharacterized protein n=1 Tax=Motilibacter rhizosphaerae TaxID=598652 RepID=A0A4Q7NAJ7_9ACTN|nr:hypothetical protein [Motilibacter rhizosphaerae]RZS79415.1 hypothetical protein EV189_3769 [Motilibacter rhizosphaerae]